MSVWSAIFGTFSKKNAPSPDALEIKHQEERLLKWLQRTTEILTEDASSLRVKQIVHIHSCAGIDTSKMSAAAFEKINESVLHLHDVAKLENIGLEIAGFSRLKSDGVYISKCWSEGLSVAIAFDGKNGYSPLSHPQYGAIEKARRAPRMTGVHDTI